MALAVLSRWRSRSRIRSAYQNLSSATLLLHFLRRAGKPLLPWQRKLPMAASAASRRSRPNVYSRRLISPRIRERSRSERKSCLRSIQGLFRPPAGFCKKPISCPCCTILKYRRWSFAANSTRPRRRRSTNKSSRRSPARVTSNCQAAAIAHRSSSRNSFWPRSRNLSACSYLISFRTIPFVPAYAGTYAAGSPSSRGRTESSAERGKHGLGDGGSSVCAAILHRLDAGAVGLVHRGFNALRCLRRRLVIVLVGKPVEHHRGGQDHRSRIGLALPHDVGRRAVARLEDRVLVSDIR